MNIAIFPRGPFPYVHDAEVIDEQPASTSGASIQIKTDGTVSVSGNATTDTLTDMWIIGGHPGIGDQFECKMSVIAGTFTAGSADEWLVLTADKRFTKTTAAPAKVSVQAALKIGYAGANSPLARGVITLEAWKQS